MTNSSRSEIRLQNILSAVTDAILQGIGAETALHAYDEQSDEELNTLIPTIVFLNETFNVIEPSSQFKDRLGNELLSQQSTLTLPSLGVNRLPARVRIVALIALLIGSIGGFTTLFLRRRNQGSIGDVLTEVEETPVLQ